MLPTAEEAMQELRIAEEMNPGPWVKHSINTGIAARKIAEKIPSMDPEKAYHLNDFVEEKIEEGQQREEQSEIDDDSEQL